MKLSPIANPYAPDHCFFCGTANPSGLHLSFHRIDEEPPGLLCRWTPGDDFRGMGRILHGGIQCGLIDEIMGWASHILLDKPAVTFRLEVDFLAPLYVAEPLEVRCFIARQEEQQVYLEAEIRNGQDQVCSRGSGIYYQVPRERFDRIAGS